MTVSRRGFLSGLAALVTAPAIIPYGNLMPVKIMLPSPEVILQSDPSIWGDRYDHLLWRSPFGEGLVCSSGRRVIGLVRYSRVSSRVDTINRTGRLEWSVERHSDGTLYFKNIDAVRYTFEKDGRQYYHEWSIDPRFPRGIGHLKDIAWSYDKELPPT